MAERDGTDRLARELFLRTMSPIRTVARSSTRLADSMQDLYLPPGSVIYRRGQAPDYIYFVVRGTIRLHAEGLEDWNMAERSVIGAIDANLDRPRLRTATTTTETHLLAIRVDDYFEIMEDNFEQQRMIVLNITAGLRSLIAELAPTGGFVDPPASEIAPDPRPLSPVERILVMRKVNAFSRTSIQALTSLAELTTELAVPAGDLAERPGGKSGAFLIVARGCVEMRRPTPTLQARFGPSSIIGGVATLQEDNSAAKLTALVPSTILRLSEEDFFDVMEDHFDVTRSILGHGALERERMMALKATRAAASPPPSIGAPMPQPRVPAAP